MKPMLLVKEHVQLSAMFTTTWRIMGLEKKNIQLPCDNCVGQNKNNAFIFYLIWQVMTGKQENITMSSFMVAGHTKFSICAIKSIQ